MRFISLVAVFGAAFGENFPQVAIRGGEIRLSSTSNCSITLKYRSVPIFDYNKWVTDYSDEYFVTWGAYQWRTVTSCLRPVDVSSVSTSVIESVNYGGDVTGGKMTLNCREHGMSPAVTIEMWGTRLPYACQKNFNSQECKKLAAKLCIAGLRLRNHILPMPLGEVAHPL